MTDDLVKTTIPDPLADAIEEIVYPAEPPEKRKAEVEAGGFDITLEREVSGRDDKIRITVPSEEAEMKLREWYGHTQDIDDQAGVNGFDTVSVTDERIVLRISRPVLITESLAYR